MGLLSSYICAHFIHGRRLKARMGYHMPHGAAVFSTFVPTSYAFFARMSAWAIKCHDPGLNRRHLVTHGVMAARKPSEVGTNAIPSASMVGMW